MFKTIKTILFIILILCMAAPGAWAVRPSTGGDGGGAGDMQASTFDQDANDVVDSSDDGAVHITNDGSDHSLIDQDVTVGSAPTFNLSNSSDVVSGTVEQTHIDVRKGSAGSIDPGIAVYESGYNSGAGYYEVEIADADDPAKMDALCVTTTATTNGATVICATFGRITGLNTNSYSAEGVALFVPTDGTGVPTETRPTGVNDGIQKIATVSNKNPSVGVLFISGANRENDVPNLQEDYVWKGNASNVATAVLANSVGASAKKFLVTLSTSDLDFVDGVNRTIKFDTVVGTSGIFNTTDYTFRPTVTEWWDFKVCLAFGGTLVNDSGYSFFFIEDSSTIFRPLSRMSLSSDGSCASWEYEVTAGSIYEIEFLQQSGNNTIDLNNPSMGTFWTGHSIP